jgi:hypothetical protein
VLQNRLFAWCEVGVCSARCCALSLALAPGPSHGGLSRVDSTRLSQLKLRGKATEPAQTPLIHIMIEVCNHAKGGSFFSPAVRESKQLGWTLSPERSREVQGTNKHATMLPSRQHINKKLNFKNVYIVCAMVAFLGLEVRERASNGQISNWVRTCRWSFGLYPCGMLH